MAESEADIGTGVILKKETAPGAGTFADFGLEITSITPPSVSRSSQDATHMASPDGHTELVFGLFTAGAIAVEVNWLTENTAAIMADVLGDKGNWQVSIPDGSTVTVSAAITAFTPGAMTPDGKNTANFTFTPSGKATWA